MKDGNYADILSEIKESEKDTRSALLEFEGRYPGKTNKDNVNDIINMLKKKKSNEELDR